MGIGETRGSVKPVYNIFKADDEVVGQTNCLSAATSSTRNESPIQVEVELKIRKDVM